MRYEAQTYMDRCIKVYRLSGQVMGVPDDEKLYSCIGADLEAGIRGFVLNMQDLQWISDQGLAHIIQSHLAIKAKGGTLSLSDLNKRTDRLFTVTRLNMLLDIYRTEEEAIKAIHSQAQKS